MILCIDYTVYTYYTVKYQHQYVNHNFYILLCKQVNMILARNVILNIAKKNTGKNLKHGKCRTMSEASTESTHMPCFVTNSTVQARKFTALSPSKIAGNNTC